MCIRDSINAEYMGKICFMQRNFRAFLRVSSLPLKSMVGRLICGRLASVIPPPSPYPLVHGGMKPFRSFSTLPPHTRVLMPSLSPTMEKGGIISWNKKEGDKLLAGDVLCEVETDKASVGFEVQDEGYLAKILVQAGTKDINIGHPIAIIVDESSQVKAFASYKEEGTAAPAKAAPVAQQGQAQPKQEQAAAAPKPQQAEQKAAPAENAGHEVAASYAAQLAAKQLNIPLSKADVLDYSLGRQSGAEPAKKPAQEAPKKVEKPAQQQAGAAFVEIDLTPQRKSIAEASIEAKTHIPHYYVNSEVRLEKLTALLAEIGAKNIDPLDIILRAVAQACKDIPEVTSQWMKTFIRQYKSVELRVTDPKKNFIIKDAAHARIGQISELRQKATQAEIEDQTNFHVIDLRSTGILFAEELVDPDHSCALVLGQTSHQVIGTSDPEKPQFAHLLNISLSCDHRTVDGATAANWITKFRGYVENPATLL
eukprot:TRINITY_DN11145_c0_g1_i4.p1 TRINITY_DN11145_c0_g1~~TRINITY_DN11145_c0_g1_i4.p1  ORF type:complete len:481 (+),score=160.92 TRINITY_DN11145_c0_g1_i4:64-1506(+)